MLTSKQLAHNEIIGSINNLTNIINILEAKQVLTWDESKSLYQAQKNRGALEIMLHENANN